jgi:hypothetical protein
MSSQSPPPVSLTAGWHAGAATAAAVTDDEHAGRFDDGMRTLPMDRRIGQFVDGMRMLRVDARIGRFDDGARALPVDTRLGRFSDGPARHVVPLDHDGVQRDDGRLAHSLAA